MSTSSLRSAPHLIACLLVATLVTCLSALSFNTSRAQTKRQAPDERFDELVRDDFFAGMMGDTKRLDRGMAFTEQLLAKNPKHADALVWHGGGLLARASKAYAQGDSRNGDRMWNQGIKEMNRAVRLEPKNIRVMIGRSATLIGLAQSGWDASSVEGRHLLQSALDDYEKVYESQKPFFSSLSIHSRGELLFGLASGYSLLGNQKKTRDYLKLIVELCADSNYAEEARRWLQYQTIPQVQHDCTGCHVQPER